MTLLTSEHPVRLVMSVSLALMAVACGTTPVSAPSATASPAASVSAPTGPSTAAPSRSASATPTGSPRETATADDARIVAALVAFAKARDARTFAAVPLADTVGLALDDQIPLERPAPALARPDGWVIDVQEFQGRSGPFSALDLLARDEPTTITVGPHPHCASPQRQTPAALAGLRRLSVQPKDLDTCLKWWTVDLYVSPAGRIATISLDLWNP